MKFVAIISIIAVFVGSAFTFSTKETKTKHEFTSLNGGIKFSKAVLSKAKKQSASSGKYIFIDVYTTWCGPCKEMARTSFQDPEVAKLYNKKFINLKIDAENDADGPSLISTYGVSGFPTLLFLNSEGKLVKKLVGKQSTEKLLSVGNSL